MSEDLDMPAAHAPDTSQGTLAGIEPPPAPTDLPTVCICGTLIRPPAVRVATNGIVFMDALLRQHDRHHTQLPPVLIVHQWASGDGLAAAQQAARQMADRLPAGATLGAYGKGLEIGMWHGERVLRLIDSVALLDNF